MRPSVFIAALTALLGAQVPISRADNCHGSSQCGMPMDKSLMDYAIMRLRDNWTFGAGQRIA